MIEEKGSATRVEIFISKRTAKSGLAFYLIRSRRKLKINDTAAAKKGGFAKLNAIREFN